MQAPARREGDRTGPGRFEPARGDRLVGQKAMGTCGDFLLEGAVPGFLHDDLVRLGVSVARRRHCHFEVAFRPGGDDMSDIGSIARPAQQMIGAGKRDEARWVFRSGEYAAGIVASVGE